VDNLLIAALILLSYRTLRRLGTWKILYGILFAAVVFIFANVFDFRGVRWIYSNLSHVAVIGFIVIFQPEIRKLFERAASLGGKERQGSGDGLAPALADVVFSLARRKWGAIIVLPGREPIKQWVAGGFTLNASFSSPLLVSLFDPHSPGHDGAAVIESGKVASFAGRLPVSKSGLLPRELGVRHHAAMGLAEVCDALVIAVSEERGAVTVFRDGRFSPVLDTASLKSWITDHWKDVASMRPSGSRKGPLVYQFCVSLMVAFLFWYTVVISGGELREKGLSAPLEFVATPQNVVMVGDRPNKIDLHLAGPKSELDELEPSDLSVRIDLSKIIPGKHTFIITDGNINLPRGVRLLDAEPSSVDLSFSEIVEREFKIQPQILGKLSSGLKKVSIQLKPDSVKVLIPETERKNGELKIMTTPIYLDGIVENTVLFCKIVAPPSMQPVEKRWPDVEVRVEVAPAG
jgi:diadenylate cyclase